MQPVDNQPVISSITQTTSTTSTNQTTIGHFPINTSERLKSLDVARAEQQKPATFIPEAVNLLKKTAGFSLMAVGTAGAIVLFPVILPLGYLGLGVGIVVGNFIAKAFENHHNVKLSDAQKQGIIFASIAGGVTAGTLLTAGLFGLGYKMVSDAYKANSLKTEDIQEKLDKKQNIDSLTSKIGFNNLKDALPDIESNKRFSFLVKKLGVEGIQSSTNDFAVPEILPDKKIGDSDEAFSKLLADMFKDLNLPIKPNVEEAIANDENDSDWQEELLKSLDNIPKDLKSNLVNDKPIEPQVIEKTASQKILKGLGKFGRSAHRFGITVTGLLPFSSRGILFNLALSPIFIPIRIAQSISSEKKFVDKMSAYMDRDWNQGIQDVYIDLASSKNADLRKEVVANNFQYAGYMYSAANWKRLGRNAILLSSKYGNVGFPQDKIEHLIAFDKKLHDMGFKVDLEGNYYSTTTGTMFNLVYDKEKKELVTCFMGLGNEENLSIKEEEQDNIISASFGAAGKDWFGAVPMATLEAIKIGKALKQTTEAADLTPVFVGHSHGGGMAQAGALANGIKGVAFNSRPLGAGVRRYIGQSKVAENSKNITTFSGKGDWLTGTVVINTLAILFERLTGIPVPRSVGTGYHLPKLKNEGLLDNHVKFYEEFSLLKNME